MEGGGSTLIGGEGMFMSVYSRVAATFIQEHMIKELYVSQNLFGIQKGFRVKMLWHSFALYNVLLLFVIKRATAATRAFFKHLRARFTDYFSKCSAVAKSSATTKAHSPRGVPWSRKDQPSWSYCKSFRPRVNKN